MQRWRSSRVTALNSLTVTLQHPEAQIVRVVFADALYYVAVLLRRDRFHAKALAFRGTGRVRIITSDAIVMEVLAYMAGLAPDSRNAAVLLVDFLRRYDRVEIVRQTPELFDEAFEMYRSRGDKGYTCPTACR